MPSLTMPTFTSRSSTRHGPGEHWLDAYPFVRLHQASELYGVASTVFGTGELQQSGPEAGLHERAGLSEILNSYEVVMQHRFRLRKGDISAR